jgi:cytochrome bd-type quinol oxidase subunit 2
VNESFWKYVEQISGVLTISGAFVVILTALVMTESNHIGHTHFSSAEITWASFVVGVGFAGLMSFVYGLRLNGKLFGGGDHNSLASLSCLCGLVLMIVAGFGLAVATPSSGGGSTAAQHACTQSSSATGLGQPVAHR